MLTYIIFFILILVLCLGIKNIDDVSSKIIEIFVIILITLFAGLRNHVGTDFPAYKEIYKDISQNSNSSYSIEPGFYFLNKLAYIAHVGLTGANIISALISSLFLLKAISFAVENKQQKWLCYIVFISIGVYFVYYFSGVRQGITISIFLFSIKYIVEEKLFKYVLFILIGSLFHMSILFFIPFYWIPKFSINKVLITLMVLISLILAYSGFTNFLFQSVINLFTGAHYMGYKELFSGGANTKTGIGVLLRIVVGVFLIQISGYWTKNIKQIVLYNLFSIGLILYCFFLGVDILNRISEYPFDTLVFVLPISLTGFKPTSKLIYTVFIIVFLAALYYSNLNFKGMNLIPYKI